MALKVLDKFKIDFSFIDIQNANYGWLKLLKRLKQDRLKIYLLFFNSKTDSDSLIKAFELGAKGLWQKNTKTLILKELNVRVNNHLETYKLIKRLELS